MNGSDMLELEEQGLTVEDLIAAAEAESEYLKEGRLNYELL